MGSNKDAIPSVVGYCARCGRKAKINLWQECQRCRSRLNKAAFPNG